VILIGFHHLVNAEAHVNKIGERWSSVVNAYDEDYNEVSFYAGDHEHKVQAVMSVFDIVGQLQAAVQRLADAEGMKDLEASAAEAKLIAGGSEALPETMVDYANGLVDALGKAMAIPESQPDGPVADSVDGYKVREEEETA
jgi:hypothetical protein